MLEWESERSSEIELMNRAGGYCIHIIHGIYRSHETERTTQI